MISPPSSLFYAHMSATTPTRLQTSQLISRDRYISQFLISRCHLTSQAALTVVSTRNTTYDGSTTVVDFTDVDLSGMNLGIDRLSGAIFTGANLSDTDLSGSNLTGAQLPGATLVGADLSGANLTDADLYSTNLTGVDFEGADLLGADLLGANLTHAILALANLSGQATLYKANLSGANLSYTNLSYTNLSYTNLSGADLSGANLTGANLTGAKLALANLTGANLTGAQGLPSGAPRSVTVSPSASPAAGLGRRGSRVLADLWLLAGWFRPATRKRYPARTKAIPPSTITVMVSLGTRTPSTIATTGSR